MNAEPKKALPENAPAAPKEFETDENESLFQKVAASRALQPVRQGISATRKISKEASGLTLAISAARRSAQLIFQGVILSLSLVALPVVAQPLGMAGAGLMVGLGLFGIRYGAANAWSGLETFYGKRFPNAFNPFAAARRKANVVRKAFGSLPPVKKLRAVLATRAQKMVESPRYHKFYQSKPVQRVLQNRLLRGLRSGLSENQQEMFLAALTLQGSLLAFGLFAIGIATHVGTLATVFASLPNVLKIGLPVAFGIGNGIGAVFAGKRLFKNIRERRRAKQELRLVPTATQAPAAPSLNLNRQAAGGFNAAAQEAAAESQNPPAPAESPAAAPENRPGPG